MPQVYYFLSFLPKELKEQYFLRNLKVPFLKVKFSNKWCVMLCRYLQTNAGCFVCHRQKQLPFKTEILEEIGYSKIIAGDLNTPIYNNGENYQTEDRQGNVRL